MFAVRQAIPSRPSLFGEDAKKLTPARPLTHAESRANVLAMIEEEEDAARAFALTLATGAEEIVADLKTQVAADSFLDDPARTNALRPSPEVLGRLRAKVEAGLLGGYDKGAKQALDAIEASTKAHQDDGA